MKLFHGSNVVVQTPKILSGLRALDFGAGFYLTSSRLQAQKWAGAVARRRGSWEGIVNFYTLDDHFRSALKVLEFPIANADWLDFVVQNRRGQCVNSYDLVIGPVANDSTLPVIDDYMDGKYDKEEAVKRLMPQKLTDQYAFLTEKAIQFLRFEGSEQL